MTLVYTGDVSGYEKLEWIQNVTTNDPQSGQPRGAPYMDVGGDETTSRSPFYFPRDNLFTVAELNRDYGGMFFSDNPSRVRTIISPNTINWMADLALIGYRNGNWVHITSYLWGGYSL